MNINKSGIIGVYLCSRRNIKKLYQTFEERVRNLSTRGPYLIAYRSPKYHLKFLQASQLDNTSTVYAVM